MKHGTKLPRIAAFLKLFGRVHSRMSVQQLAVLLCIAKDEGLEMSSLSNASGMQPSSTSMAVNKLVEFKMVERRQSPHDARYVLLYLTPTGSHTVESAMVKSFGEL